MKQVVDPSDLYGLPLERFTAERNALAKRLRQDGRRDEASEVSKLRKPSVAAWAVNQLIRTQKREVQALFEAGDAMVEAQESLLARRESASSLRDATDAERTAVDGLVGRAQGLLSGGGVELSAARLEQVRETLHAAALDGDARAQVSAGCLERELRYAGLGSLGGGMAAQARPARKDDGKERAAARRAAAQAERRRQAQARLNEAEEGLAAAARAHDKARRERDRAQRALDDLS